MTQTALLLALAISGLTVPPAMAQEAMVSELRFGVMAHNASIGWLPIHAENWDLSEIEDVSFDVYFHAIDLGDLPVPGQLRPTAGATVNFAGKESLARLGVNWQAHLGDSPVYIEATLGAAIHNGILSGPMPGRHDLRRQGCRVELYSSAGLGMDLGDTFTATLVYEHMSNANLCGNNDGLSNFGLRIGAKFE